MTEPHYESSCQCEYCGKVRSYANDTLINELKPEITGERRFYLESDLQAIQSDLADTRKRLAVAMSALKKIIRSEYRDDRAALAWDAIQKIGTLTRNPELKFRGRFFNN